MDRKRKEHRALGFILVPLGFAVLNTLLLFLVASPILSPYVGLAKYLCSDKVQPQPADLYAGLAEGIAHSGEKAPEALPLSGIVYPQKGDRYGQITVEGTSVDAPLYYGDSTKQLNRGVATYADSSGAGIPGQQKTVLLAGHNNTFFNGLQDVRQGALVHISTHYGEYVYRVTKMKVLDYQDESAYDFTRTDENLILYTCYPFDALGFTPQRYFVYGEYVSGPVLDPTR